jgi:hypothetical protein
MKKGVLYSLIILVSAINIFLLYKINKGNEVLEDKENYCLYRDRNLLSEIENLNYKAPLKMVSSDSDTHIVLRYNENSCSQCVFEAEALLEEIFGKKDMCIVGPIGIPLKIPSIQVYEYDNLFSPMDSIFTPYMCVINSDARIIFTLRLHPEDLEHNKKILLSLKSSFDNVK